MVRGDDEVVEILNAVLTNELTAINQYFLHYRIQEHWGFHGLGRHYRDESIDEMKHADKIIHRILYLDGHPNLQRLHPLRTGENVPEMLELDYARELENVETLRKGVTLGRSKSDFGSATLLEWLISEEEEHIDWLEAQLELIRQLGAPQYLAEQIHEHGSGD
ncbi:bacterioferritin [Pseudofrankia sp. DC12]|uniref:bacterioferritin n=1 Tax=Pseudofrankia sp. DC12 TaxID=683315 RepID=UPI0005F7857E|nr:bacterioferritin [Pseudofrankia sp. DC12]